MGLLRRLLSRPASEPPIYQYSPAHTLVNDYSEFSDMTSYAIAERIRGYRKLNREAWAIIQSRVAGWEEAARRFYEAHDAYVFDHLSSNPSPDAVLAKLDRFNPEILRAIRAYRGKRLLEFGGGTGGFCECMCREGFDVTYLDIPGSVKDFAEWRFKKYGLPIKVITSSPDVVKLEEDYDVVFTDAVFEHLIDPEQALRELLAHIRPGGLFVFLVDLSGPTVDDPQHRYVDIERLHGLIEQASFTCGGGRGTFASLWRKPALAGTC
jgi:2-polyprenyl-3-methyl-5-hydroxy-6-metoxy-1,4-benzoquinol methylase